MYLCHDAAAKGELPTSHLGLFWLEVGSVHLNTVRPGHKHIRQNTEDAARKMSLLRTTCWLGSAWVCSKYFDCRLVMIWLAPKCSSMLESTAAVEQRDVAGLLYSWRAQDRSIHTIL